MMSEIILLAAGSFAGILGAMLGLGGGIILVPALSMAGGLNFKEAIACSMAAVMVNSFRLSINHLNQKNVHLRLSVLIEFALLVFGIIGAQIAIAMKVSELTKFFSVMTFVIAAMMLKQIMSERNSGDEEIKSVETKPLGGLQLVLRGKTLNANDSTQIDVQRPWYLLLFTCCSGTGAGLFGLGGGMTQVPAMMLVSKLPLRVAAATSGYTMGAGAAGATLVFYSYGMLKLSVLIWVLLGVTGGVIFSFKYLNNVPQRALKSGFIVLLVVSGVKLWTR